MEPVNTARIIPAAAAEHVATVDTTSIAKDMAKRFAMNTPLLNLITPVSMECTTLYEDVMTIIEAEHPEYKETFNTQWKEVFLTMRIADARKLIALHSASGSTECPKLVSVAEDTMMMLYTFDDEAEADQFTTIYLDALKESYELDLQKKKFEQKMSGTIGVPEDEDLFAMTDNHEKTLNINHFLDRKRKDYNIQTMPAYRHINLLKNEKKNPFFEEISIISKNTLTKYNFCLERTLRQSYSRDRPDLKPYIFADIEKCEGIMLFSRYGMEPTFVGDDEFLVPDYPFENNTFSVKKHHFVYRLENISPADLEDEIRNDLHASSLKVPLKRLPARLLNDHHPTIELNEEMKEEQKKIKDKLDRWTSLTQEEKDAFKADIFSITGWALPGFKKDDFVNIVPPTGGSSLIQGTLVKYGIEVPVVFDLRTLGWNLVGLVRDADSMASLELLQLIFTRSEEDARAAWEKIKEFKKNNKVELEYVESEVN